jgi:hypothetical protein
MPHSEIDGPRLDLNEFENLFVMEITGQNQNKLFRGLDGVTRIFPKAAVVLIPSSSGVKPSSTSIYA